MTVEIKQIGNPVLRQIASPIVDLGSPTIQTLIDTLIDTAIKADGVGIAAPQIGESSRLFIVASRPNPRYPDAPLMQPLAMINPLIIAHSEEKIAGMEGCLSIQGKKANVLRYREIVVQYWNRKGKLVQQEYNNFIARIIQHELDHLNGILFVDHVLDE
jgi:peptide deformylase